MSPNIGAFTLPCVRKLIEGHQIFCKDSSSLELIIARIRHRWTRRHKWKIRLFGVLCFKRRAGKRKRVGKSGGSLISRRKIIYALLWLCFLLLSHSVISVWKINCAKSALSFFLSVFSFLSLSLFLSVRQRPASESIFRVVVTDFSILRMRKETTEMHGREKRRGGWQGIRTRK